MTQTQIDQLKHEVSAAYGVSLQELEGESRMARIVFPRQIGMYLCLRCGMGTKETAMAFGRTEHGTALHAGRAVLARMETCKRDRIGIEALVKIVERI